MCLWEAEYVLVSALAHGGQKGGSNPLEQKFQVVMNLETKFFFSVGAANPLTCQTSFAAHSFFPIVSITPQIPFLLGTFILIF